MFTAFCSLIVAESCNLQRSPRKSGNALCRQCISMYPPPNFPYKMIADGCRWNFTYFLVFVLMLPLPFEIPKWLKNSPHSQEAQHLSKSIHIYPLHFITIFQMKSNASVALKKNHHRLCHAKARFKNCLVYKTESTRTLATKSISQRYCFSAPSQCHSFSLMSHCGKSCIDTLCIATRLSRART